MSTEKQNYATSIQEKLARMMQGTGYVSKSNPHIYKPTPRTAEEIEKNPEYIRVLPYKDYPDPFLELYFHYNIGTNLLCPVRTPYIDYEGECPICNYASQLMKNDFKNAIKRVAQVRVHFPIVVRGQEFNQDGSPNIKFWGVPSTYNPKTSREFPISMQMMKAVNDPDIGKFWDPLTGTDIRVDCLKPLKDQYAKPIIEFRRKSTKLMESLEKGAELIKAVPDWTEIIDIPSAQDLQNALDKWIESLKSNTKSDSKSESASSDSDVFKDDDNDEGDLEDLNDKLQKLLGEK